jgi:hypothetical protein
MPNKEAMMELVRAIEQGQGFQQLLEDLGYQIEVASRLFGRPIHVIFAPANDVPLAQCDEETQHLGIDAITAIVQPVSNDLQEVIEDLVKIQSERLKQLLHAGLERPRKTKK